MKLKVIEYKMICSSNTPKFNDAVNTKLKEGWELYGHPFADVQYNYQCLVKYDYNQPQETVQGEVE